MDTNLTNEEIAIAVQRRVLEHKYWDSIAAELKVTPCTLWRARKTERWAEVALEVVNEIKAEAFPVAWQGLLDIAGLRGANAESARIAACKEILNRVDEVIEQTVNVTGAISIFPHLTTEQLSEIASHNGDYGTASKDGAGAEGGNGSEDPDA